MSKVRILILGTGGMANTHAEAYAAMPHVALVAGIDTDADRLALFCEKHGIAHGFASVEAALAWGEFDAVSNVTPDSVHHLTTLPLLAAGKHVLCEKPLAANQSDADAMAKAAAAAGVVNMVNLSYRGGAALMHAAALVAQGAIGDVRHFEASYLQSWLNQPAWGDWKTDQTWLWRLSQAHGSMGVLGDVGVHILDFATFVAGSDPAQVSCRLATFAKAEGDQIGPYKLDANDSMTMQLRLENGAIGVVHASRFASGHMNDLRLRIYGTKGALDVRSENHISSLSGSLGDDMLAGAWKPIKCPAIDTNYVRFVKAVRAGEQVEPNFARGARLQRVLDMAVVSDAHECRDQTV